LSAGTRVRDPRGLVFPPPGMMGMASEPRRSLASVDRIRAVLRRRARISFAKPSPSVSSPLRPLSRDLLASCGEPIKIYPGRDGSTWCNPSRTTANSGGRVRRFG
jgi:hypothetical protein